MKNNKEVFYLKVDTDSGIDGFVLLNRQEYHYGTTDQGILHDLFEHSYKLIKNPYLDEIAALGAYNEYRINESSSWSITKDLEVSFIEAYENKVDHIFKWDVKYLSSRSEEVEETINCIKNTYTDENLIKFVIKYKYLFSYYFNVGADIFNNRFSKYFNSYYDLYHDVGTKVIDKLKPLVKSDLEKIKLTIDYKAREVKVEY